MTQLGKSGQVQVGLKIYINLPQVSSLPNVIYNESKKSEIFFAASQGKLLERCFIQGRNVYKKTVKESGLSRQWAHFLQRLVKLIEDYNQLLYCTINLKFIRRNFKII